MTTATTSADGTTRSPTGARAAVALAILTVALQIAYPLVTGSPRDVLTVVTVVSFFAASVLHALSWRGAPFTAALVAVSAGGGLAVEAAGVRWGLPFGSYVYGDSLGWTLLGVPVVIPMAWTMMTYPALVVARRITCHAVAGPLLAGWALASWDLFLDPQMVQAGHWSWSSPGPSLTGIPLSNYAGWLATAVVMMALLWRGSTATELATSRPPPGAGPPRDDRVPLGLYLWTWAGSVVAHAVFLGNPQVALAGGLGMGAVVALLVWSLRGGFG